MGIGVLCALLAGAMWGMVFIAPRALPAFSPWELTLGRYLAYGVIAAIAAAPRAARSFGPSSEPSPPKSALMGSRLVLVR